MRGCLPLVLLWMMVMAAVVTAVVVVVVVVGGGGGCGHHQCCWGWWWLASSPVGCGCGEEVLTVTRWGCWPWLSSLSSAPSLGVVVVDVVSGGL